MIQAGEIVFIAELFAESIGVDRSIRVTGRVERITTDGLVVLMEPSTTGGLESSHRLHIDIQRSGSEGIVVSGLGQFIGEIRSRDHKVSNAFFAIHPTY